LATDWTVSDDGLTYTFTIKSDVKWHDGESFTPEDVKWNFGFACKALVNAQVGNALPSLVGYDEWVDQTEITDLAGSGTQLDNEGIVINGNVITIKLTEPNSKFLTVLVQFPMLPKHLLVNEDPLTFHISNFWINPIGTGPYKISLIKPGSYTILEAFEGYDGSAPKIQTIQVLRVASTDVSILMALDNKIDYLSGAGFDAVMENPAFRRYDNLGIYERYFEANTTGAIGDFDEGGLNKNIGDVRVRQALMLALDRPAIIKAVYKDSVKLANASLPSDYPWYDKNLAVPGYDPEKAKQLLEEADYDFNEPIKLAWYYNDQNSNDLITAAAASWEAIGLKVELLHLTTPEADTYTLVTTKDYDYCLFGCGFSMIEDVYIRYTDGYPSPATTAEDTAVFSELTTQMETVDMAGKIEILKKMQVYEQEIYQNIPLFFMPRYNYINEERVIKATDLIADETLNYKRNIENWEIISK
ncbi:MAG: ABC transporter substrate-binding protein, partial [Bacteroidales bacterium]|nr:ABC transporter substrate-binding protein [Bacteroidales bacterium]